jgi:hypothetical protein
VRRAALAAVVALVALAPAACGGSPQRTAAPARGSGEAEGRWLQDVDDLMTGLDIAVERSTSAGADHRTARQALRDDALLLEVVVGYTYLRECGVLLERTGLPEPRLRVVVRELRAACGAFERSSTLFRRAMSRDDPGLLVAAGRQSLGGAALVARARDLLGSLRRQRS